MAARQISEVIRHLRTVEFLREGAGLTDGQLLEDYLNRRDEAALGALVRRHGPTVWGVCCRVLRNRHDAEDAFQASFLVLVRKAASIAPRELVANWLYGVAHRTALKARATAAKRQGRERQVAAMPEPAAPEPEHPGDLQLRLDQELSRLPDKYRVLIVLCDLEGKTRKEVAQCLGCPEGTVAGRLARARAMLAKRLARHGAAVSGGTLAAILSQSQASAGVPPSVVSATLKVASLLAAGQAAVTGAIAPEVAALTEGVLKAMLLTKLKTALTVLLVPILGLSVMGLAYGMHLRGQGEAQSDNREFEPVVNKKESVKRAPVENNDEPKKAVKDAEEPNKKVGNGVKTDAGRNILKMQSLKDDDLLQLPDDIEGLLMRGRLGYGSSTVTDDGVKHLARFKKLRILEAAGLGLTDRALETIGKLTTLEELSLEINKISGAGLRHLAGLKKLRRLNLNYNQLNPAAIEALVGLPELAVLKIGATMPVDDRLCELCSRLTQLQELQLGENTSAVSDRGLAHLANLKHLENLVLSGGSRITDAGLAKIARLKHLRKLRMQDLRSVTPEGMKILGKLTELRSLEISFVRMDQTSVEALTSLTKLEDLMLWAVNNRQNPIALDCLGELRALRTFRTQMPVASSAIRALARLPELESISDELFEITDEELVHLARLPKLNKLILASPKVTAAALPTLAKMTSLRELYVTEKVGITPEQWTRLGEDSLLQCRIGRFRPPYTVYHDPKP